MAESRAEAIADLSGRANEADVSTIPEDDWNVDAELAVIRESLTADETAKAAFDQAEACLKERAQRI